MRYAILALAFTLALAAAGTAQAKAASKGKAQSYQGTIISVERSNVVIDISTTDRPQRLVVAVDKNTQITGGGKKGTINDLAKGMIVTVDVAANHHATKIDVTGVRQQS